MTKKSTKNTTASIALFDELEESKKVVVKKETVKKQENGTRNSKIVSSNKSRSTSSTKSNKSASDTKIKKETKETKRGEQRRTSSAEQKPKSSRRTASKNTDDTSKAKDKVLKSGKSAKNTSKSSKSDTDRRKRKESEIVTDTIAEYEEGKRGVNAVSEEVFKEAKRNRRKQERTSIILPPKQITGKPKPVKDDLVAIIVDGEYLEVSPWSVKNGVYHQGFDSNFIVKYLHYEPITTKFDEIDIKNKRGK